MLFMGYNESHMHKMISKINLKCYIINNLSKMRKFQMAATFLHERYIYYLSFTLRFVNRKNID